MSAENVKLLRACRNRVCYNRVEFAVACRSASCNLDIHSETFAYDEVSVIYRVVDYLCGVVIVK